MPTDKSEFRAQLWDSLSSPNNKTGFYKTICKRKTPLQTEADEILPKRCVTHKNHTGKLDQPLLYHLFHFCHWLGPLPKRWYLYCNLTKIWEPWRHRSYLFKCELHLAPHMEASGEHGVGSKSISWPALWVLQVAGGHWAPTLGILLCRYKLACKTSHLKPHRSNPLLPTSPFSLLCLYPPHFSCHQEHCKGMGD